MSRAARWPTYSPVRATSVVLDGGAAGPGGVSGYCICQNAGATERHVYVGLHWRATRERGAR